MSSTEAEIVRAGLARRLLAVVYDALVLAAILMVGTLLWLPFTGGEAVNRGEAIYIVYQLFLLAIIWLFYAWFWTHGGQTVGMRAWRMQVKRNDGESLTWGDASLRLAAAAVSWLALGLGWLWVLVRRERLTWHDRWTNTETVLLPKR